jgi:hypothetical protein
MANKKTKAARLPALAAVKNWPPAAILDAAEPWAREFACDIDEVVLSYLARVSVFAKQMYPHSNLEPNRMRFYDPGYDPQCTLSPYEWEYVRSHFLAQDKGAFGDRPLMTTEIVDQLWAIANHGIRIRLLTYVPDAGDVSKTDQVPNHTSIARRLTLELIKNYGLPIDPVRDVTFVYPGQKKDWIAERYIPLIAEDNIETAAGVATYAHACILMPTSYNEGFRCPNVLRLKSRSEFAVRVIEFYDELEKRGKLRPF